VEVEVAVLAVLVAPAPSVLELQKDLNYAQEGLIASSNINKKK
jgi:hypothetical protein